MHTRRIRAICFQRVVHYVAGALLCFATQAQADVLTGDELRDLVPGNTLTAESNVGDGFDVYHDPNGKMLGRITRGRYKGRRDDGTWEIDRAGQYCRQWFQWGEGERECFEFVRDGDQLRYRQTTGIRSRAGVGNFREGNPAGL